MIKITHHSCSKQSSVRHMLFWTRNSRKSSTISGLLYVAVASGIGGGVSRLFWLSAESSSSTRAATLRSSSPLGFLTSATGDGPLKLLSPTSFRAATLNSISEFSAKLNAMNSVSLTSVRFSCRQLLVMLSRASIKYPAIGGSQAILTLDAVVARTLGGDGASGTLMGPLGMAETPSTLR